MTKTKIALGIALVGFFGLGVAILNAEEYIKKTYVSVEPTVPDPGPSRLLCSTPQELMTIYQAILENDKDTMNRLALHGAYTQGQLDKNCHFVKGRPKIISGNEFYFRVSMLNDTVFGYMSRNEAMK